jgi:hypothetical protein
MNVTSNTKHVTLAALVTAALILIILFPMAKQTAAACFNGTSLFAVGSATSISSLCTISANTSEVSDFATGQNSTNTSVTTITAAVTVTSGTSGTTTFGSGSFVIGSGGSIAVGSTQAQVKPGYPAWLVDADADFYALNWTANTATAAGRQRLGLMKSVGTLDCNDNAYSTTNTCYAAFYPAFYPSFGPYGGFSPYSGFYPQFSP